MNAAAQTSFVGQVLRILPRPLLRALDAWSQRVARRRWQQRQRRWTAPR